MFKFMRAFIRATDVAEMELDLEGSREELEELDRKIAKLINKRERLEEKMKEYEKLIDREKSKLEGWVKW